MCVVSNIGDQFGRSIPQQYPWVQPAQPAVGGTVTEFKFVSTPTRAEFDALKADVEQLRIDIAAGRAQDAADGNPDCEMAEKVSWIRGLCEFLDVDPIELAA